jgi:phosphatidylglycerol:prolipoprotein diacylglycerol transferase
MRPVLFRCRGIPIHSYPVALYLGIVLGIEAQLAAAQMSGLSVWRILAATVLLLPAALFGARMLFVCRNWAAYRGRLRLIWKFGDGGAAMYGGLILAVPLSLPVLMALDIPFGSYWDVTSFTLVIGFIVTRAGCFLNGCCAGRPCSGWLTLNLPNSKGVWKRRIPTQILEALWGMVVLAGALLLWGRLSFPGAIFCYAIGTYGAGRAVLQLAREEQDRVRGINLQVAISVLFVGGALAAFVSGWR